MLARDYPAHMHANLLPRAKGKGFGGTLGAQRARTSGEGRPCARAAPQHTRDRLLGAPRLPRGRLPGRSWCWGCACRTCGSRCTQAEVRTAGPSAACRSRGPHARPAPPRRWSPGTAAARSADRWNTACESSVNSSSTSTSPCPAAAARHRARRGTGSRPRAVRGRPARPTPGRARENAGHRVRIVRAVVEVDVHRLDRAVRPNELNDRGRADPGLVEHRRSSSAVRVLKCTRTRVRDRFNAVAETASDWVPEGA